MKKLLILFLISSAHFFYADSLKITFLGDTHFGESYGPNPKFNDGVNVIEKFGYDFFFGNVKEILLSSDFTIANLETPLSRDTTLISSSLISGEYVHFSNPDSAPFYLAKYGIDAVSLGNNHILDLGFTGLSSTLDALNAYGVTPFGAGFNEEQAGMPLQKKFSVNGKEVNVYIFSCYWYRSRFALEKKYYASGDKGGVNMLDVERISAQIRIIRENDKEAFIIIYPHWGSNYKSENEYQIETAHRLIDDAGADLIIGHGAHTIQHIEEYNGKWIIYNIGNFIFNAPGRYASTEAFPYGLIVQLVINDGKKSIRLYPIYTNNKETNYSLRFLNDEEFNECYKFLDENKILKRKKYFEILLN